MKYIFRGVLILLFIIAFYFGILIGQSPQSEPEGKEIVNSQESTHIMQITSPSFSEGEGIPTKFTCDGEGINPELIFTDVPKIAKSLALVVDDPDIPDEVKIERGIDVFDHWVVFDMPGATEALKEGEKPLGIEGLNSAGKSEYRGPCPPDGEHRYFFKLYALDTVLNLSPEATKEDVEEAMAGHILEKAELIGVYTRK